MKYLHHLITFKRFWVTYFTEQNILLTTNSWKCRSRFKQRRHCNSTSRLNSIFFILLHFNDQEVNFNRKRSATSWNQMPAREVGCGNSCIKQDAVCAFAITYCFSGVINLPLLHCTCVLNFVCPCSCRVNHLTLRFNMMVLFKKKINGSVTATDYLQSSRTSSNGRREICC